VLLAGSAIPISFLHALAENASVAKISITNQLASKTNTVRIYEPVLKTLIVLLMKPVG
jgi:hypothetical protein